jgi:hypothetical protein
MWEHLAAVTTSALEACPSTTHVDVYFRGSGRSFPPGPE